MGQTIRRYPIVEVAIKTQSCAPLASGHERVQEGDIVAVRPAGSADGLGLLERHRHVWLRLSGWDEEAFGSLTDSVEGYDKRRYRIPLARLAQVVPGLSLSRLRDPADLYQPILGIDDERGEYLMLGRPLDAHGLVFDTVTGRYL